MNQQLALHIQQLKADQIELQSALEQLQTNPESYKLVGSIMVQQDASTLKETLTQQLEDVQQRLAQLQEQLSRGTTDSTQ